MASLLNNPDVLALIAALAAVGVLGLVWQALMINDPMPARLKALSRRRDEIRADMAASKTRRGKINQQAMMKQVVDALKLANSSKAQNMRTLLMQAGYRSRDALTSFLFAKMALGLGLAAGLFFLVTLHLLPIKENFSVLSSLCGGFLGWILPDILVKNTAQKRAEAMR
ncbi:MAG: hypothetical protein EB121_07345, partial [Alphaproteobacteria bacterium]|nr:hypothetical protein [Alphaproteobacteria bacterium]